ncbi:hypothetical protein Gobs01_01819 [Geodermatophilus obscurus DSM 43160]
MQTIARTDLPVAMEGDGVEFRTRRGRRSLGRPATGPRR